MMIGVFLTVQGLKHRIDLDLCLRRGLLIAAESAATTSGLARGTTVGIPATRTRYFD
jgi:hypothetical protein